MLKTPFLLQFLVSQLVNRDPKDKSFAWKKKSSLLIVSTEHNRVLQQNKNKALLSNQMPATAQSW